MSINCTYCLKDILNRQDIYMANDNSFCCVRHRDNWLVSGRTLPNLKIKTNTKINTSSQSEEESKKILKIYHLHQV